MRQAVVLTVENDLPRLGSWMAHHLACGPNPGLIVAARNSRDGGAEFLRWLRQRFSFELMEQGGCPPPEARRIRITDYFFTPSFSPSREKHIRNAIAQALLAQAPAAADRVGQFPNLAFLTPFPVLKEPVSGEKGNPPVLGYNFIKGHREFQPIPAERTGETGFIPFLALLPSVEKTGQRRSLPVRLFFQTAPEDFHAGAGLADAFSLGSAGTLHQTAPDQPFFLFTASGEYSLLNPVCGLGLQELTLIQTLRLLEKQNPPRQISARSLDDLILRQFGRETKGKKIAA